MTTIPDQIVASPEPTADATPNGTQQVESSEGKVAEPTITDLLKKVAEQDGLVKKLEGDLKAKEGRNISSRELTTALQEIRDTVDAQGKVQEALARRLASGETEGLPTEVATIQNNVQQTQARRAAETEYNEMQTLHAEALEEAGLDQIDPLFKEVNEDWQRAASVGDIAGVRKAFTKGAAVIGKAVREQMKKQQEQTAKETQAAIKAKLDDAEVNDLSVSGTSGGRVSVASLSPQQKIEKGLKARENAR